MLLKVTMTSPPTVEDVLTLTQIPQHFIQFEASIFDAEFIRILADDLESCKRQVAQQLNFPQQCLLSEELYRWCKNRGSTLFVLFGALSNLRRLDCVNRILRYLEMHTMQLYVLVEEAGEEGLPNMSKPRYEPVTTRCEFTLVQALENRLGGDLTHYEIVGPEKWVTWSTLARELKGQQLTLRHYSHPVPHTHMAVYGSSKSNTELKNFMTFSQNIPTDNQLNIRDDTEVKRASPDPMKIENLKCPSMKSLSPSSVSDSNNERTNSSLETEEGKSTQGLTESVIPGGPSSTNFSHLTLDSEDHHQFTLDSYTLVKVPMTRENTKNSYSEMKFFSDKVLNVDATAAPGQNQSGFSDQHPLDPLNNVPCLSLIREGFPSVVVSNSPESVQIQSETLEKVCEFKQNNLNCVSAQTCTHGSCTPVALSAQNVPFICVSNCVSSNITTSPTATSQTMLVIRPENKLLGLVQDECSRDSAMSLENVSLNSNPDTSSADFGKATTCHFAQSKNTQCCNISNYSQPVEYVPLEYMQTLGSHPQNTDLGVPIPSRCRSPGSVLTPPNKRHRLNEVSVTSTQSAPPQQQIQFSHQLQQQQQTFMQKQSFHVQNLQNQHQHQMLQQHQQQQPPQSQNQFVQDITHSNVSQWQFSNVSAMESQVQQTLTQQLTQHHQHPHSQIVMAPMPPGSQPVHIANSQPVLPGRQIQSWSNSPSERTVTQVQRFHSEPQQTSPLVQQQQQSLHRLQPSTQASLLCHTPPPTFLEVETDGHVRAVSEPVEIVLPQGQSFLGTADLAHSPMDASQGQPMQHVYSNIPPRPVPVPSALKTDLESQYMDMKFPSSACPPSVPHPAKSEIQIPLPSRQSHPSLPQFEFLVRLPHQQELTNSGQEESKILTGHPDAKFPVLSTSGSSRASPVAFRLGGSGRSSSGSASGSFREGAAAACRTPPKTAPQPFNPAPPTTHHNCQPTGFSHPRIPQVNSQGEFRAQEDSSNSISSDEEERYNYIDNAHVNRSVSLPANHWSSPDRSHTSGDQVNIADELTRLDGWCPTENGDTIQGTMENFRTQDGSFIIWKSRRHDKFVITVSHLSKLVHLRVEEDRTESGTFYYLFRGGFRSQSLLEMVHHYRRDGVRMPLPSSSGSKKYNEHIKLRYPLRVRLERKRRDGSKPR